MEKFRSPRSGDEEIEFWLFQEVCQLAWLFGKRLVPRAVSKGASVWMFDKAWGSGNTVDRGITEWGFVEN
jgi:hypothetical protein